MSQLGARLAGAGSDARASSGTDSGSCASTPADGWARRTLLICHSAEAAALPGVRALVRALSAA